MLVLIALLVLLATAVYMYMQKSRSGGAGNPFGMIADNYKTVEEVSMAVRKAGLESSNLIVAIDYTKSNVYQGEKTFGGKCLHHLDNSGCEPNPYQQIMARTLAPFDDDNIIPLYGFGDSQAGGNRVRPLFGNSEQGCHGLEAALSAYTRTTKQILEQNGLSGPTNFAPAIRMAIDTVRKSGNAYHILVIIADGQVTAEQDTVRAIVEASDYPLSIIVVGVGDGPWEMMQDFGELKEQRKFDNFQFVDYHKVVKHAAHPEAAFALHALMEIPQQFQCIRKLKMLGW